MTRFLFPLFPLILPYLKHQFRAGNAHSIHSPFVYNLYTKAICPKRTKPEEFKALQPDAFLSDPTNLVVIEWPEKVKGFLPKPDVVIRFSAGMGDMERNIDMEE